MTPYQMIRWALRCGATLALTLALACPLEAAPVFIPKLVNSSTVPANGDVNPYGVAFVPQGFPAGGALAPGDVLVSNFNNSANQQGTGTTIVQLRPSGSIAPPGSAVTFYTSSTQGAGGTQGTGGTQARIRRQGLSTALGVLQGGFVLVGNVPTTDGTFGTIGQGTLQVIDRNGRLVETLIDAKFLDSPWDLALNDEGTTAQVFVSNVLSGTVTRLDVSVKPGGLSVLHRVTLATGYTHVPNAAALVLGPTGLAFDASSGTLYVASTADNAIYAIADAASAMESVHRGTLVFADQSLRGPLALKFAPDGNLLAANGDAVNADLLHPSEIVEFTKGGEFVREYNVDASQGGSFGLDTLSEPDAPFNFAAIDDVTNNLSVYQLD
jgi:DNA-binding beta-propeller fold protein YncE